MNEPKTEGHRIRPIMANVESAQDVEAGEPDGELADECEGEDVEVESQEADEAGEEDAGTKVKVAPTQPSNTERERHEVTHCPYRSWCPVCVWLGEDRRRGTRSRREMEVSCQGLPWTMAFWETKGSPQHHC